MNFTIKGSGNLIFGLYQLEKTMPKLYISIIQANITIKNQTVNEI
ncbi:hypothetical protein [Persephonella sp.]